MAIAYISDIKYKGFHPIDKKNVIKDINLLIDRFNEDDNILQDLMFDARYPATSFAFISENAIKKELGNHRSYLLAYIHEMRFNVIKLNERLQYIREKEFKKFLDSITQNSKKSIETIRKEIFNWYANEKKFITNEKDKIHLAIEESVKMTIKQAKAEIKTKQEKKREKSLEKLTELIKQMKKDYKNNAKAEELLIALEELKSILFRKQGNLTQESLQLLISCFKDNRNWKRVKISYKMVYSPVPKSDNLTNQVIINLYGMITDGGTDLWRLIQDYIKKQVTLKNPLF